MPDISRIWLLGDMIGGLSYPGEVLDRIMDFEKPVRSVSGNHENYISELKRDEHPDWRLGTQFATIVWTADNLKRRHFDYLEKLKISTGTDDVPGGALLFHGSPADVKKSMFEYGEVEKAVAGRPEKFYAGGHTHKAKMYRVNGSIYLNPGSVGIALDGIGGVAEYALIDENIKTPYINIMFRRVAYDIEAAVGAMIKNDFLEIAPGITRAIISEMRTGRFYVMSLLEFVNGYTIKQIGYSPGSIPAEIWREAEKMWDGSEWTPGRMR